ncbi:uncharacterized protein LOC141691129 [Apium graveolens]|uniref:uncharacterized protein LOC141691129 n=1 Tax=Apium graveolens TaxID=4045 RepID=UPI003D7A4608
MEKAFELAEVKNDKKAQYASYYLKDEASYLWESTTTFLEGEAISWEKFTELFLEKYLPSYMQDRLHMRFLDLKQENMMVAEYEVKFSELARFVPKYVNTEVKNAKRFQQGIKPWIRIQMALLETRTYATLGSNPPEFGSVLEVFQPPEKLHSGGHGVWPAGRSGKMTRGVKLQFGP